MGGAAGHMAHPFDCREVRSGKDLIKFYVKAVNAIPLYEETDFNIRDNATSLKLDGVNASFRLQQADNPAGFMFVLDRGATSDRSPVGKLDYAGITPDNALARFKNNPDHGMIQVVNHISKILNHDLEKLRPFVQALGIFEQMGPDGIFFDVEYYSNEDPERGIKKIGNVTDYNQSFIAIHGLKDFYTEEKISKRGKITTSRKARGFYWETNEEINNLLAKKDDFIAQGQDTSEIDRLIVEKNKELNMKRAEHQDILSNFGKAVAEHANELDLPFNVHTKIGLQFKEGLTRELVLKRIEDALEKGIEGFSYKKINENESFGPTMINEQTGMTGPRPLKDLLLDVERNPAHVSYYPDEFRKTNKKGKTEPELGAVKASDEWIKKHGKSSKQSAFAKQFYDDIIQQGRGTGVGAFNLGADDVSSEAINDAVILWESVRVIGNVLKDSVIADTDLGPSVAEQEGIVIQSEKICDGIAFKFTGDFIVSGGESPHRKEVQPVSENTVSYGKLLESFFPEPMDLTEQEQKQYVILIPGGFKPPTGGHYDLIKQYDKNSNVVKVFVVTGAKERDGVTLQQSKDIFAIYGGFSDKVEFITANDPTPLTTCYELMKNEDFVGQFPNAIFSIGAGDKGNDPARIKQFAGYFEKNPNLSSAKIGVHPPAKAFVVDGQAASASRLRKAYAEEDWETFKKLLPSEAFYDDVVQVLSGGAGGPVNENFLLAAPQSFLVERQLTAAEYKKKGEIAKAIAKDNPDMPDEKKYAIATSTAKRVAEDLIQEEERFKEALRPYLANIVADIEEFGAAGQNEEMKKEIIDTLAASVSSQLEDIIVQKSGEITSDEEAKEREVAKLSEPLEEMSSMAGGAVQGYAGNAFIGEEDDEQERSTNARV